MTDRQNRIFKSIEWIENQIISGQDLLTLDPANVACLSPYHYHRLFKSMTGMSPGVYIRRRLMTCAAEKVMERKDRIIDIAIDTGFESQAAFTRAFKAHFGVTPAKAAVQEDHIRMQFQAPLTQADVSFLSSGGVTLTPEMRYRHAFSVTGFKQTFGWSDTHEINQMWGCFNQFLKEKGHTSGTTYGVCLGTTDSLWLKPRLEYLCGVEDMPVYPECVQVDIPAGDYAVFTHRGDLFDIQKTIAHIWQVWVPRAERELRPSPDFELYDARFDVKTLTGEIEIWVPVV